MLRSLAVRTALVVLVAALASGVAAPVGAATEDGESPGLSRAADSDRSRSAGDRIEITEVQVCGRDDYDDADRQCSSDAAGTALLTDTLYCTALVRGAPGDEVAATFFYDGREAYSDRLVLDNWREEPLALWVTVGPEPLPGGDWECELTGDSTEWTEVRSTGPRGDFLHGGACETADTVEVTEDVGVCAREDRSTSFRHVESVTCSAVLTDVADRPVRLEVEYEGAFDAGGRELDSWRGDKTLRTDMPVVSSYVAVDGESMTRRRGSDLPVGDYTCRWLVDGDELGRQRFVVTGAS